MDAFHYSDPAEVYVANGIKGRRNNMAYRRFETAAKAIRFIVEDLPSSRRVGTVMEVNERRHYHQEIRALYDNDAFPLPKQDDKVNNAA
ncbi:MAG: hypothetical protein LJE67_07715 [Salaquimonas sp.]|jgi:hypothetical protein|nr:hypothetical protein [Salaquimonas sp.]